MDPNAVEFIPLTGDLEPARFRQIPESAIHLNQQQHQDPETLQQLSQGQQAAQHDDYEQQQQQDVPEFGVPDLDRCLSSFALDHISPATTATTLALAPASFVQYDDEAEDSDQEDTGMDMGVGPVSCLQGPHS